MAGAVNRLKYKQGQELCTTSCKGWLARLGSGRTGLGVCNLKAQTINTKLKGKVTRAEMFTGNSASAAQKIWAFYKYTHTHNASAAHLQKYVLCSICGFFICPCYTQLMTGKPGIITLIEMTPLATSGMNNTQAAFTVAHQLAQRTNPSFPAEN